MKRRHLNIRRKNIPYLHRIIQKILSIHALTLFNHRTDHINLTSLTDLLLHKRISLGPIRSIHNTILNRKSLRRKLINHRNIQITINNDSKSTRNRCCTHYQNIRRISHRRQGFPLLHTETVLLIRNNKPQIIILHLLLYQSMRSYDQIRLFRCDQRIFFPLLLRRIRSGKQYRMTKFYIMLLQQLLHRLKMLPRQNLRRRHQNSLITILNRHNHRQKSQNRFSASHISLNQPGHQRLAT